jgi:hypothetical protein
LATAVLLNQQNHDANSSNDTAVLAQQQLLVALDQQRHLYQNGMDNSAIQHQLTALTAVNNNPATLAISHAQQAQAGQVNHFN